MSELIDRKALLDEIWKMRMNYQMMDDTHTADKIMHGLYRAEQAVKEAPTIAAPRWVRVEDGLPKENGRYLVYCQRLNAVKIDEFKNGLWLFASMFNFRGVTHWMPLPEPPGEEG